TGETKIHPIDLNKRTPNLLISCEVLKRGYGMASVRTGAAFATALAVVWTAAAGVDVGAQGGRGQAPQGGAPAGAGSARALAPVDLVGYWVSVVTEDWRFRMVTPPKGDFASVPLNAEGRRVANTWDPSKDGMC